MTPFLVSFLLMMAVVEEGGGEGARDREENQPVAGWKLEPETWESCNTFSASRNNLHINGSTHHCESGIARGL